MAAPSRFSDVSSIVASVASCNDPNSHRWMVHFLAEMIEYSEAHELHDVAGSLIAAIEKISPALIGRHRAGFEEKGQTEYDSTNVIVFQKKKYPVSDVPSTRSPNSGQLQLDATQIQVSKCCTATFIVGLRCS